MKKWNNVRYIAATLYRILLQKDQYTNVRIIIFPALYDHARISSKLITLCIWEIASYPRNLHYEKVH